MAKRHKTAPSIPRLTKYHRSIIAWLEQQGATDFIAIQRTRHVQFAFRWRDQQFVTTLSSTPGCIWIAEREKRRDLRHQLGLVGVRPVESGLDL